MKRRRRLTPRETGSRFILLLIGIGLLMAAVFSCVRWLEKRNENPEPSGDYRQRMMYDNLIEIDGETYRPRKRLTTILLMGIDQEMDAESRFAYRSGGQADFLRLIVIDAESKQVYQIQIDRDTMTPITILGVLGNRSGMREAQIALSHSFGDGAEQSCKLTVEAVSNLLLGIDIDYYVAMSMDGVAVLNDAVGGVTVTLEDDFAAQDSEMVKGTTLRLSGKQAEVFVRTRRHFVEELYDDLSPYVVTNLSKGQLINEAWFVSEYEHIAAIALEGDHQIGRNGFMEFIVDEKNLEGIVLGLFYEKVP